MTMSKHWNTIMHCTTKGIFDSLLYVSYYFTIYLCYFVEKKQKHLKDIELLSYRLCKSIIGKKWAYMNSIKLQKVVKLDKMEWF